MFSTLSKPAPQYKLVPSAKPIRIVGRTKATGGLLAGIKEAKVVAKAVVCIDKVDTTASSFDIIRFVNNLSIRVISCFEVKSRQPAWQRQLNMTVDGWKAFRLCIDINNSSKLLDT